MPHISLPEGVPGIRSLALYRPETGKFLYELAQQLLRGDSTLSEAERELIAAFVSFKNNCGFCMNSHAAAARCLYKEDESLVDEVLKNPAESGIDDKMKALLAIAAKVQVSGKLVSPPDIEAAKNLGATEREIHDTVLIAASFSMFNRYVDGLSTLTPTNPDEYAEMGRRMTSYGYVLPQNSESTTG